MMLNDLVDPIKARQFANPGDDRSTGVFNSVLPLTSEVASKAHRGVTLDAAVYEYTP